MKLSWKTAIAAAMVLSAGTALAAPSTADKCKASKNKLAGTYYMCREKAEALAISKGTSPDYSRCAARFGEKWNGAEMAGGGMCPDSIALAADVDAFIAGQATAAAAVVAGAQGIPVCGDGVVNVPGEHCDDAALDGKTCAAFGKYGSLACNEECEFDLSTCTACPAPGVRLGEACWFLGAVEASCDTACAALGLDYDDSTATVAGSGGTDANCTALLHVTGAPGGELDNPSGDCTSGLGCAVYTEFGFRARCATPPTASSISAVGIQRLCACK